MTAKCLTPSVPLLCKIGSIVVHSEEIVSSKGHHFDFVALDALTSDEDVRVWIAEMRKLALIPEKR